MFKPFLYISCINYTKYMYIQIQGKTKPMFLCFLITQHIFIDSQYQTQIYKFLFVEDYDYYNSYPIQNFMEEVVRLVLWNGINCSMEYSIAVSLQLFVLKLLFNIVIINWESMFFILYLISNFSMFYPALPPNRSPIY